jgi:hypothetical protein
MKTLTNRDIEIFKLLNRYRYVRRTFIHALLAHNLDDDWLRHRIYDLSKCGYLREPSRQKQSGNYRYCPRIYELAPKGKAALVEHGIEVLTWNSRESEFWHQVMIGDVVASIEIAAKQNGIAFAHRQDVIRNAPLHLTAEEGYIAPDDVFSLDGVAFALEADRATETNASPLSRHSSWAKKIHQYSHVFKNRTYQTAWNLQSLIVLCMFTSSAKAENVRQYITATDRKSRSLWFSAKKSLGSHDVAPQPMHTILDDIWQRAGHEPATVLSALDRR